VDRCELERGVISKPTVQT